MAVRSRQTQDPVTGSLAKVISLPVPRSEAGLVVALRRRQPEATGALVDRHGEYLLRVTARLLGPHLDPEPIVTEALLRGIESLHLLREPRALRTLLTSLVVPLAMGRLRSHRWRQRAGRLLAWPWRAPREERSCAEWSETLLATYRILDHMSDRERSVLVLRMMQGMELVELSCVFGQSLRNIRSILARAEKSFLRHAVREPILHAWVFPPSRMALP